MEERGWQPPSDMSTWHSDRIFGLVLQVMMVVMMVMEVVMMVMVVMMMVVEDVELVVGSFEALNPLLLFKKRNTAHMK